MDSLVFKSNKSYRTLLHLCIKINESFSITSVDDDDTDYESLVLTTTASSKDTEEANLPIKPRISINENAGNLASTKFIGPQLPKEVTQERTTKKFNYEKLID